MRYAFILLIGICAGLLSAQVPPDLPPGTPTPEPSALKESFVIQPGSVDPGVRNFAIRMVSNAQAGFANSSSKPPAVEFSAGVTLVPGTFQVLNQNEAQCSIDVDDDAAGTIEVSIDLFSVNGTRVLTTLRATLGIKGTTSLAGSQAKVGAENVTLVQVNVATPQAGGVLLITGEIVGSVQIKAPAGCAFSAEPAPTISSGSINSPKLEQANTIFSFAIGNTSLNNVTVRVESIQYNTQFFGLVGGVAGDLACELTGAALSNQTALVVNAFTAKTEIQGSNDNGDPPPPSNEPAPNSESSNSTSTSPGASSINTGSRPLDSSNNNRDRNRNNRNTGNTGGSAARALGSAPGQPGRSSGFAPLPNNSRPFPNSSNPANPGGGRAVGGGGTGGEMGGAGSISQESVPKDELDKKLEAKTEPKKLEVSPGLYFCDKDFSPVTALVLDKMIADEAGGRVWIVLKLKKDKNADKQETTTVKLTVNGTTRELTLTETGKNTGEFRCGNDGILVVANENPDSNREEKEAEPPKPRFPR